MGKKQLDQFLPSTFIYIYINIKGFIIQKKKDSDSNFTKGEDREDTKAKATGLPINLIKQRPNISLQILFLFHSLIPTLQSKVKTLRIKINMSMQVKEG